MAVERGQSFPAAYYRQSAGGLMIRARTEAELADAVRGASGQLRIVGGGTRAISNAGAAEVLETGGLSGISLYEPGALTLVAGAGTPLAEVEALLASEGQRLPFEVPDMRALLGRKGVSTLGGVVAANAAGPRRVQVGACRDSLIGVRFVDGTGTVIKNGGRVMKNVTGYDLVKLMAGSHGTLGVLTEVSFKVLPVPEAAITLVLTGLDNARAVAAMSAALASPYEVSGAAHWPGSGTYLRLEGFSASVSYRAGQLADVLADFGPVLREDDAATRWSSIRDVAPFHDRDGDIWRVSVKPSDAPMIAARAGAEAAVYDWGGGLIWMLTRPGTDLRAQMVPFAGHATRVRGAVGDGIAAFHPETPALAAIAKGLRGKFDPRGILNQGLM
jgi:glycolate oxidase FAD binding subunit